MLVPRAIVFDLDGTLLDTREDIVQAMSFAFRSHGREPVSASDLLRWVGDGARLLCARAAGLSEDDPGVTRLVESYVSYYVEHPADHATWLPGVVLSLEQLRAYPLAICTNKPRAATLAVLDKLGARSRFDVIVADGDIPENKPDPRPIRVIAERLGVTPAELVVVGDGPQDVEAGARAGARTIGVIGPIVGAERLAAARPDVLLDSMAQLPPIMARWADATVRHSSSKPPVGT